MYDCRLHQSSYVFRGQRCCRARFRKTYALRYMNPNERGKYVRACQRYLKILLQYACEQVFPRQHVLSNTLPNICGNIRHNIIVCLVVACIINANSMTVAGIYCSAICIRITGTTIWRCTISFSSNYTTTTNTPTVI